MATKKPVKELAICIAFVAVGTFLLAANGFNWQLLAVVLFFGAGSIILIHAVTSKQVSFVEKFAPAVSEIFATQISVSRYPYKYATIYGKQVVIPAGRITSVFSSPGEAAFILDGREIIFLAPEQKEAISTFAENNNIQTHSFPDIWGMLSDPFLDTEYTEEDRLRDYATLEKLGFSQSEVKRLRRKIRFTMYNLTFRTWEWRFYSTDDLLRAYASINPIWFTKTFYWQVMEVALRPYHLSKGLTVGSRGQ